MDFQTKMYIYIKYVATTYDYLRERDTIFGILPIIDLGQGAPSLVPLIAAVREYTSTAAPTDSILRAKVMSILIHLNWRLSDLYRAHIDYTLTRHAALARL